MAHSSQGDPVMGIACPKCRHESIVYNGNYFCVYCPWVMPERRSKTSDRIIVKYLLQRRADAIKRHNNREVERMDFYLKDYDGMVV